jgi:hypothetical protein
VSDFISRLAARAVGAAPVARPLLAPRPERPTAEGSEASPTLAPGAGRDGAIRRRSLLPGAPSVSRSAPGGPIRVRIGRVEVHATVGSRHGSRERG